MIIDGITLPTGETLDPTELSVLDNGAGTAKAWLNYNGLTQTVNASFNVTSVVRESLGTITINFTTPMTDANYVVSIWNNSGASSNTRYATVVSQTTTSFQFQTRYGNSPNSALEDQAYIQIAIFGN